jgi:hypothetical protein
LKAIHNPLVPVGGADADAPARIRTLAPQSVMTFGRAVSLDDYQAIAASTPGVVQAKAEYQFDPLSQRPCVILWIAGDAGIAASVQTALAAAADPNRPVAIRVAQPLEAVIRLTYLRDPRFGDAAIQAGITAALLDPDHGLFGVQAVGIGQVFYNSQIYAACRQVPGVTALRNLTLTVSSTITQMQSTEPLLLSYALRIPLVHTTCAAERHDPGAGRYFSIPDDGQHIKLIASVAS